MVEEKEYEIDNLKAALMIHEKDTLGDTQTGVLYELAEGRKKIGKQQIELLRVKEDYETMKEIVIIKLLQLEEEKDKNAEGGFCC